MLGRAALRLRAQAPRVSRAQLNLTNTNRRALSSTAAAEPAIAEEAAAAADGAQDSMTKDFHFGNPPFVWLCSIAGAIYVRCIRWAILDKKHDAKIAEIEAAKHADADAHAPDAVADAVAVEAAAFDAAPGTAPALGTVTRAVLAVSATPDNPATWKVADVLSWLDSPEPGDRVPPFKEHAVDGKLLLTLHEQEMYATLNIVSPLRRKKLAMAIAELRASYVNP